MVEHLSTHNTHFIYVCVYVDIGCDLLPDVFVCRSSDCFPFHISLKSVRQPGESSFTSFDELLAA